MRLLISAVGSKPGAPEAALIEDYLTRAQAIGRNIGFSGPDLHAFDAPRGLAGSQRQAKEGALLLGPVAQGAEIVALDEKGDNITSEKLAALVGRWRDDGVLLCRAVVEVVAAQPD